MLVRAKVLESDSVVEVLLDLLVDRELNPQQAEEKIIVTVLVW